MSTSRQWGLALLSAAWFAVATARADEPFVRPPAAPAPHVHGPCDLAFPSTVPLRCWINQKIIVLPAEPEKRADAYGVLFRYDEPKVRPTYDELAGKIATVTAVEEIKDPAALKLMRHAEKIVFALDDTGKQYYTVAGTNTDEPDYAGAYQIALLRDLQEARRRYSGRSFWILSSTLPALALNTAGQHDTVKFRKFGPVTISDVLASDAWSNQLTPVRFVLKNDAGEEAYFDDSVSDTNKGQVIKPEDAAGYWLHRLLTDSDPHIAHNWPQKVWDALATASVFLGMTQDQARMSWGEPTTIEHDVTPNHAREKWIYGKGTYLEFDNGSLAGFKN